MRWGRTYFAVQATAGLAWWWAVFTLPAVRALTLGALNPIVVARLDVPLFVISSALAACGVKAASVVCAAWTCVVAVGLVIYATTTTLAGWGVIIMVAAAAASVIATLLIWLGRLPIEWIIRGPFAFRPARMRSNVALDVVFTIGQMIVFWGVFLVAIPVAIDFFEQRWRLSIDFPASAVVGGICLLLLASGLGVASALTMAARGHGTPLPSAMPNQLVVAGPYRWVRNPMAVAGILQGIAVGLIVSSWLVIVYAVVGSVLWNYAVRPLEESDLDARFEEQFREYRARVRCWLPRVPQPSR